MSPGKKSKTPAGIPDGRLVLQVSGEENLKLRLQERQA